MDQSQFVCKVVLIGDSGVGKTSIFNRRLYDKFNLNTPVTVQPGQSTLKIKIQGIDVHLKLWDTAGQEKYRSITINFYKETKGAFIIFDMTQKSSFDNVKLWSRQLKNHGGDDIVKIILGNKSDLECQVQDSEVKELAQSLNANYFIVSAFKNQNITEAFDLMGSEIFKRFYIEDTNVPKDRNQSSKLSVLKTQEQRKPKDEGCC